MNKLEFKNGQWFDIIDLEPATSAINATSASSIRNTKWSSLMRKIPEEANNVLYVEQERIRVDNCINGKIVSTCDLMPDIKNIEVKYNGENNTVIFVTFADGKTEKAILDKEDEFSLEHGLLIIMFERLLNDKGVDGKSVHNKLINHALKFYKKQEKEKENNARKEAAEKEKRKKMQEKIAAKKRKQAAAEKEYQIEIQKEAYIRAMKEMQEEN